MAKRKKSRNTLLFILLGLILALIAVAIIQQRNKPKGEIVDIEKAGLRTINETVSASGKVFPEVEVKISSDVSGEIVDLFVEEGDSVVAGQLLAKIDPDAYKSQVERGEAGVNSSKANLANSRSQVEQMRASKENIEAQLLNAKEIFKRNELLKKDGAISTADYENSLANLRALEANFRAADANINSAQEQVKAAQFNVASSEAALKELRTSLKRTTIYAPTSGIISKLNVEKGERVVGTIQMAGTEMMRIANLNAMEVRVEVTENDIPRVSIGDEVDIEVDAYINRKFKGRVTQIGHSATNTGITAQVSLTSDQVTNFEVRINIDPASYKDLINPQKRYPFRPGMSANVEVYTEKLENALSVPIQSVTTREKKDDKWVTPVTETEESTEKENTSSRSDLTEVVFVAVGDTVDMVEVKTGIQDDDYIQIVSGLEEGAEVISGPYQAVFRKLKQGEKIERKSEKDKKNKTTKATDEEASK